MVGPATLHTVITLIHKGKVKILVAAIYILSLTGIGAQYSALPKFK